MEQYSFSVYNEKSIYGLTLALEKLCIDKTLPVFVCIGTDGVVGDSLGPFVGTLLKRKRVNAYVYGHLSSPITAKEVPYLNRFLSQTHPQSKIIAIDSAVGVSQDIGLIKITNSGIKPGLGAKKDLPFVGDMSIIGVMAEKDKNTTSLLKETRLRLVFEMATIIAEAIEKFVLMKFNSVKNIFSTKKEMNFVTIPKKYSDLESNDYKVAN